MLQALAPMADKIRPGRPPSPELAGAKPKQKGVVLPSDEYAYLAEVAHEQRRPMAVLMREILVQWVKDHRQAAEAPAAPPPKKPRSK
jgi:hypothetical protein